jgi:hypothetical protein
MPSLDDAYGESRFEGRDPRRVYGGMAVVVAGALVLFVAVVAVAIGGDKVAAKRWAGLLAGLGIPALLCGVVAVLPASTRARIGVVVGAALNVVGVALFWHAYPGQWTRTADSLAFETAMVYGLGGAIALWFVFTAVATAHIRNNPHGTVTLELVQQGSTRTVQVSRDKYDALVSDGGDPSDVIRELDD